MWSPEDVSGFILQEQNSKWKAKHERPSGPSQSLAIEETEAHTFLAPGKSPPPISSPASSLGWTAGTMSSVWSAWMSQTSQVLLQWVASRILLLIVSWSRKTSRTLIKAWEQRLAWETCLASCCSVKLTCLWIPTLHGSKAELQLGHPEPFQLGGGDKLYPKSHGVQSDMGPGKPG